MRLQDFPDRITEISEERLLEGDLPEDYEKFKERKKEVSETYEAQVLRRILSACDWKITEAAKAFGMNRSRLHQLMKKHGIERTF